MEEYKNKTVTVVDLSVGLGCIELAHLNKDNVILCINPKAMGFTEDDILRELNLTLGDYEDEVQVIDFERKLDKLPDSIDVSNDEYFANYGEEIYDNLVKVLEDVRKEKPNKIRLISDYEDFRDFKDIVFIEAV